MSDTTQKDSYEDSNYDAIEKRIIKEKEKHNKSEEYVDLILRRLTLATKIWLGIFFLLSFFQLYRSTGCEREGAIIACLTVNEIGDFLAGFFAPLAFIWLAATVFIQSREFRAQREELTLTRIELALSRGVAEEAKEATKSQASEAERSGDFFETQTNILKEEHELRKQKEEKELYIATDTKYRSSYNEIEIRTQKNAEGFRDTSVSYTTNDIALEICIDDVIQSDIIFASIRTEDSIDDQYIPITTLYKILDGIIVDFEKIIKIGVKMSPYDQMHHGLDDQKNKLDTLRKLKSTIENAADKFSAKSPYD